METKQNWRKWVRITLLVALTITFVTIGLALADRGNPSLSTDGDSLARFEQYQAAIESAEQAQDAAIAPSPVRTGLYSTNRFEQYLAAIESAEQARDAAIALSPARTGLYSTNRLEQYLAAIEMMEREQNAVYTNP